jgi:pimeloyl-ACP methyl ester carboxylesterase
MIRSLLGATVGGVFGEDAPIFAEHVPAMSWRYAHEDVSAEALVALDPALRHAVRVDIAVLVHGLLVDERNFTLGLDRLVDHLAPRFGWQPVMVRYNTGRHISDNGEALADALVALADALGPRLGSVQLIGHSMGGLVSRSALAALERRGAAVLNHVERLFLLATPNQGAELERLGHAVERTLESLHRLPGQGIALFGGAEPKQAGAATVRAVRRLRVRVARQIAEVPSRPLRTAAALVALRSDGIRDLRYGYLQAREWQLAESLGDRFQTSTRRPLPPPAGVRVYAVAGSLMPRAGEVPSRWRTDGVVSVASVANHGGAFDELRLVEQGRFVEVPLLVHQLAATSRRVTDALAGWVERSS